LLANLDQFGATCHIGLKIFACSLRLKQWMMDLYNTLFFAGFGAIQSSRLTLPDSLLLGWLKLELSHWRSFPTFLLVLGGHIGSLLVACWWITKHSNQSVLIAKLSSPGSLL
jgi:hypothetical protein